MASYTLGLSGWPDGGHDASAVLLCDGVPIVFIEQERVTRIKHAENCSPFEAIEECLRVANVPWHAVEEVTYGFDIPATYATVDKTLDREVLEFLVPEDLLREHRPQFHAVEHHVAHAASAFLCCDLPEATVLVVDGTGETAATSIYHASSSGLRLLRSFSTRLSLGFFYQTATVVAGLGANGEGKLMGLASYGRPSGQFTPFELNHEGYELPGSESAERYPGQSFTNDLEPIQIWWNRTLSPRLAGTTDVLQRADYAADIQAELERVMVHLVRLGIAATGVPDVIITGGVGLNCSYNGRLQRSGMVRQLVVSPIASDVGIGLGSALYRYWCRTGRRPWTLRHAYLGRGWSDGAIDDALRAFGSTGLRVSEGSRAWDRLLDVLEGEGIVAWFDGRAEVGPRALGARSILADPRVAGMTDRVNHVKGREPWRPLAPSASAGDFGIFFDGAASSDYMLLALPVTALGRRLIPATTHVDGTARPQSVRETQPTYNQLISRWKERAGVPVLLNTSFNLAGEPIVHTPSDALQSFTCSEIDALWLNSRLIEK